MARQILEREDVVAALRDVFLEHGYAGTTLALIEAEGGVGKSSLYHFFRGGKEEMAAAVLADLDAWYDREIIQPLLAERSVERGLNQFLTRLNQQFDAGRRGSLQALFALDHTRDRFSQQIKAHFYDLATALTRLIGRAGYSRGRAWAIAEEILGSIHGGLVLARGLDDPKAFGRMLRRLRQRLQAISKR